MPSPPTTLWLACYDVACDKRRRRAARVLLGFGERIQESVFLLRLAPGQQTQVLAVTGDVLKHDEDKLLLVPMCAACEGKLLRLGLGAEEPLPGRELFIFI